MRKDNLHRALQGLTEAEKIEKLRTMAEEKELAYWRAEGLRVWKEANLKLMRNFEEATEV